MRNPTWSGRLAWVTALAVLTGAGLRAAGACNELWLDEIWSIRQAGEVTSPIQILTRLKLDNNHPLNTFFLWLIGETRHGILYRLPAVAAGIGTLALAAGVARTFLPAEEAALSVWLLALSFPLIVYDSEARGYAPAIFFAFLAFLLADLFVRRRSKAVAALFCLACALGFLSHATFLFVFIPLAGLAWLRLRASSPDWRGAAGAMALLFLPAALAIGALAAVVLRGLEYGGGPRQSLLAVLSELLLSVAGISPWVPFASAIAAAVAAALALALFGILRSRRDAALFLAGVFIIPLLVLGISRPPLLYLRYFLVCLPFLLILLASLQGALWRRGRRGRAGAVLVLAVVLAGNAVRIVRFLELGRGHFREAVEKMSRESARSMITVTSDHDFRNGIVLAYYARLFLPRGSKPMAYSRTGALPPGGTEWLIRHSSGPVREAAPDLDLGKAGRYRLVQTYPYCGELSGFNWYLYRRI